MVDDDLFEDEVGTQQPQQRKPKMDTEATEAELNLSAQEKTLKRQREENQRQREAASEEYETKTAEAKEKANQERESRGEPPVEVPEECSSFPGYGEFYVPKDMNIRGQDYRKGSPVALTWDEYQTLRGLEVYCEPVPKPPGLSEEPNTPVP